MARRRQETLWIHRWSRPLIAGIAGLGILETGYLTWSKLTGNVVACPVEGCDRVLNSPYATVFGLPLPLFGLLAYGLVFVLAVLPLPVPATQSDLRQTLESRTWPLLFILTLAMVIGSGYLMYLMAFELKAICPYCITSALFSLTLLILTLLGRRWEDSGQLIFNGIIVGMVTLTAVLALYAPINGSSRAVAAGAGESGPPVTNPSGVAEIELARHLKAVDAKMYGAWWCPHCYDQKALFGAEAAAQIPYIECASDGKNAQPQQCRSHSEITGFPTWEINGEFYAGTQTLEKLAELSGYTGSKSFRS
ncbi:MAG: vitamin K epoxide reductase family protein [Cyanobacteria bacterium Co-bin8]|nr:vitamin K epoxide reductase family protein [Cyanobacteria bacterium Co-bin8]